ncbi:hypothetical protein AAL_06164 [Moelleriella libera RCEF 2490]|uniref:Uncharacterized protein n=1 Tax=Moelleriella libera RCEF 2490 TaxID=1081109 RepID=A0A167ZE41_9HYPO|nr:hypothetical protein AAL_06164 [Moelleriella libera RCEF 2490]
MAQLDHPERRPLTPSLILPRERLHAEHPTTARGPTSPPVTPTTSPHEARRPSFSAFLYGPPRSLSQDPNIKPLGNGHQFSYQRAHGTKRPGPNSPTSSSSGAEGDLDSHSYAARRTRRVKPLPLAPSDDANGSSGDGDESERHGRDDNLGHGSDVSMNDDDDGIDKDQCGMRAQTWFGLESTSTPGSSKGGAASVNAEKAGGTLHGTFTNFVRLEMNTLSATDTEADDSGGDPHDTSTNDLLQCQFLIEDVDPMDSGCEGLEVLYPAEIESIRSRSESRHKEFDRGMTRDFKNLRCSNEAPDDEMNVGIEVDQEAHFRDWQRERRRKRRVSMSSSLGKRTHSERSDSDESAAGTLDVNDVGSSAWRTRKRLHRSSLLFQDPPAPRIDELEEPDSDEDEFTSADPLARELPYWTLLEIMEMDAA